MGYSNIKSRHVDRLCQCESESNQKVLNIFQCYTTAAFFAGKARPLQEICILYLGKVIVLESCNQYAYSGAPSKNTGFKFWHSVTRKPHYRDKTGHFDV